MFVVLRLGPVSLCWTAAVRNDLTTVRQQVLSAACVCVSVFMGLTSAFSFVCACVLGYQLMPETQLAHGVPQPYEVLGGMMSAVCVFDMVCVCLESVVYHYRDK